MSFIQIVGLSVLQFNYKLVILMCIVIVVNVSYYFLERKNKNINGLRVISFFTYFFLLDFFCSKFIQLDFNKSFAAFLSSFTNYSMILSFLSGVNWLKFNVFLSGFLMIINEVNFMIRYQFHVFELVPRVLDKVGDPNKEISIDEKEYNAGRFIGILERILIYIFVLENQYAAVGLILAAKGFARFKELENRNRAEYVLIGTLLSTLLAFVVALITKEFLK
ncbi:MAG: hypothetical protein GTO45_22700 [Candidatus Aminicenantes bacterium]|nr:hypothetical protein [Candidatus Aminicenantes bacterium]NIM81575.1 hypothetical protein [Candidatus Aminicenantes bacterium]NIN20946.1 hypothetical protein [Candidatus Aminicenantes bacterium]NIN44767.1 hypothetical protein [Candidatus Aminicenantes bacterium]NIN87575.1 hypothetical protein [Candidatus Aminicenantes bacterium]